ncbi:MAG: 1-deoxy-D-xylulose-5-phosphate reductoisomerase [Clostridiales bacterium]|jgi:1-deoxy-D-xylulose-5-phosphate reductoisomerase|nr:1-deoxy-D-xylulose-5-phosphate reductoisomerase [Clostridiales bacterium]
MKNKLISILGSTGSIGKQALDVARNLSGLRVCCLAARTGIDALERQMTEFQPSLVCVTDACMAEELRRRAGSQAGTHSSSANCEIVSGEEGLLKAAAYPEADMVLNALSGAAGLKPTAAAIRAGKNIALANKETLVMAGEWIMRLAREAGVALLPVDSEHSAIFQCLQGNGGNLPRRVYLTASGGPFRLTPKENLAAVLPAEALAHPNWSMGPKITVDCATMMNKGLEIMEAKWLFDLPASAIAVLVHPQSIIHSMVEFEDGAVMAQLGAPDMRLPIQYAFTYPERRPGPSARLDFLRTPALSFEPPDTDKFPCLTLAREALDRGGLYPAVLNAANEMAVAAFLESRVSFTRIPLLIEKVMVSYTDKNLGGLEDVLEADAWARERTENEIQKIGP